MTLENMDELTKKLLSPVKLAGLDLRNRIIKTGAYEGMTPDGVPSDLLVEHHRELAENGVGLTTLAYCAVSPNGRTPGLSWRHCLCREYADRHARRL